MTTGRVDLAASDSAAVRNAMRDGIVRLILGPLDPAERISSNPSDTYLTGVLWPRENDITVLDDDSRTDSASGSDPGTDEEPVPGYRSRKPCSIGITFATRRKATLSITLGDTARYVLERESTDDQPVGELDSQAASEARPLAGTSSTPNALSPSAGEATSTKRLRWKRVPLDGSLLVEPNDRRAQWSQEFPSTNCRSWVRLDVKRRESGSALVFTITLVNNAPEARPGVGQDASCLFQAQLRVTALDPEGRPAILARPIPGGFDDDDRTNELLYRDVREYATGHGIAAAWAPEQAGTVEWVATTWMPEILVKGVTPRGHKSLDVLRAKADSVLTASRLSVRSDREQICRELREFCAAYRVWIDRDVRRAVGGVDADLQPVAADVAARCDRAHSRMMAGVALLETDTDAWIAFGLANEAMNQQSQYPAKGRYARPLVWRPFQLAFILLSIRTIAVPSDPDRSTMDLLWFPTGGGKTEAYLALTAFQIFLRRLQHQERRDHGGVDVLMRYTLRLLTVQQFQRAAALITACEFIRKSAAALLGDARVTLGLFVGGDSTPNDLAGAAKALEEERSGGRPRSTPRQLLKCPVCGSEIKTPGYSVNAAAGSMSIRCGAERCKARGAPLPVMTVDEAIYQSPPSLLIGTVDKFAQLPRSTKIRAVFGLDTVLRPGLIVQDELHLISGPLGSMTGLYEAAIDYLCTDGSGARPKIIGSTATIGRAARQVRALFDRDVMQFPPPGLNPNNSFFAVTDEVGPDRLYLGVASAGRSPKFTLQAVVAAALQVAGSLRAHGAPDAAIDSYWTCVAYFNSLRELGGAHVMMMDDVPRQMTFLSSRLGTARRELESTPRELSSRVLSSQIPETLLALEHGFGGDVFDPEPADTVLASNMISVGVDIPRLGLMVVNGQPKSTSEYIQATSRVGRQSPGLVVTSYNFGRPRDLSHFEHFAMYHAALYRGVEATSVTPWAPRARDKALHAILIAAVRHSVPELVGDEDAAAFRADHPRLAQIADFLVSRATRGSSSLLGTDTEGDDTASQIAAILRHWHLRSSDARASRGRLRYWVTPAPFGRTTPHLMRSAEEARTGDGAAWPTPNSLREVEPSTPFALRTIRRNKGDTDERT